MGGAKGKRIVRGGASEALGNIERGVSEVTEARLT